MGWFIQVAWRQLQRFMNNFVVMGSVPKVCSRVQYAVGCAVEIGVQCSVSSRDGRQLVSTCQHQSSVLGALLHRTKGLQDGTQ